MGCVAVDSHDPFGEVCRPSSTGALALLTQLPHLCVICHFVEEVGFAVPNFGDSCDLWCVISSGPIGDLALSGEREPGCREFNEFFRSQLRPLIGLAYALSGNSSMAEDIAQDALGAAAADWERVGRMGNPEAWVRRVVANRSRSIFRRRMTEIRGLIKLGARVEEARYDQLASDSEHMWELVRRLPKRQAQVITLRALDRSTVAEIAGVLEISEAAASTHLRRGRAALAQQISQGEEP